METVNMKTIPGTDLQVDASIQNPFEQWKEYTANAGKRQAEQAVETAQSVAKEKTIKEPKTNDKKVAAQRLFEANKDKGNGEIAKMIASELEITYANAYYYVTRVFKR
jgi:hypothetical protein